MPKCIKCIKCNESKGIFELNSDKICKSCIKQENPNCNECHNPYPKNILKNGTCPDCLKQIETLKKKKELSNLRIDELNSILLTTESNHNLKINKRLDIISSECAFGMNLFKDFFTGMRDIFGGRSNTTQDTLRKARTTVLDELKKEAYILGANAVIGVDLKYSEFSGGGKSMLFIVATGTAVIIDDNKEL